MATWRPFNQWPMVMTKQYKYDLCAPRSKKCTLKPALIELSLLKWLGMFINHGLIALLFHNTRFLVNCYEINLN